MNRARNVVLLALLGLAAVAAQAQEWRGPASLALEVKGKQRGNVAEALVILRYQQMEPPAGPRPVLTDSGGRAVLVDLAAGVWEVEVSHDDFLSFVALVLLQSGRKPAVQASFLQASGSSLTPIRVKFMNGKGKSPSASVPLPPEAAARLAQRRPPPPPPPPPAGSPGSAARERPQPVMPEPELRPLPETARPAEKPSATPPPKPATPEPTPPMPEPTAPPEPQPAPPMPEPAAPPEPEPAPPILEAAPPMPEPTVPPDPEPAPPTPEPAPLPEPEPATPLPEATAAPEPEPAPPMPKPAAPQEPEPAPTPLEPTPPPEPEPAPPMPKPVAPPEPEPQPEPQPEPEPEPEPPIPELAAPPEPEPAPPMPEPVPDQPEPEPAPVPPPTPPTPTVVLPPPGPLGPTLRAYRDRTCVECRPGEWAISVEAVAGPADGPCRDSIEADGSELATLLGGSVALELKEIAAPAAQALGQLGSAEASTRGAELLGDSSRACRIVAAVIPKAARFRGARMEAADASGIGDCQAGRPCPVGRARWLGQPRVAREPSANVIWGLFANEAPDRARRARLTIYFAAPNRVWDPPRQ